MRGDRLRCLAVAAVGVLNAATTLADSQSGHAIAQVDDPTNWFYTCETSIPHNDLPNSTANEVNAMLDRGTISGYHFVVAFVKEGLAPIPNTHVVAQRVYMDYTVFDCGRTDSMRVRMHGLEYFDNSGGVSRTDHQALFAYCENIVEPTRGSGPGGALALAEARIIPRRPWWPAVPQGEAIAVVHGVNHNISEQAFRDSIEAYLWPSMTYRASWTYLYNNCTDRQPHSDGCQEPHSMDAAFARTNPDGIRWTNVTRTDWEECTGGI